jgi:glycosyltransferase involved in cell wall biosynthesis
LAEQEPQFSVIVPLRNARATLQDCLSSIRPQLDATWELIAVDDASDDGGGAIAAQFATRVETLPEHRGAAAARNAGAKLARGRVLVFTDADVIWPPGAVERLRTQLVGRGETEFCLVGIYAPLSAGSALPSRLQAFNVHALYRALPEADCPYSGAHLLAVTRNLFAQAGGFDEAFAGATIEDLDFGYRVQALGQRIAIAREVEVIHAHEYDWRGLARNYYRKAADLAALALTRRLPPSRVSGRPGAEVFSLAAGLMLPVLFVLGMWFDWADNTNAILLLVAALLWWRDLVLARRTFGWRFAVLFYFFKWFVAFFGGLGAARGVIDVAHARLQRRRNAT